MATLLTAVLVLIASISRAQTQTFTPNGTVSHLRVTIDVEGDITWHSNSASQVSLAVTLSTDERGTAGPTIEFTEDTTTATVVLRIQSSHTSSSVGWSAGWTATLGLALLASVFVTRASSPALCLLLVAALVMVALQVSANGSLERADVAILVPRNYSFTSIVLASKRGGISVDQTLLASDPNIRCYSGTDGKECGSCCQANGQCIDGQCQCKSNFAGDECEIQTDTSFTLHDDPTDPVIMTLESVAGEQLDILGDKDGSGIPSRVDSLILDDGEGNRTFVTLNENTSLPDTVSTDSGARIQFEWSEDLSMVHVTAVSPDGKLQVTVNVDLNITDDSVRDIKRDVRERKSSIKERNSGRRVAKTKRESTEEGNVASVAVTVSQCGEPETEARVYGQARLNYDEDTMEWAGEKLYQAVSTGTAGEYHIQIFTGTMSTIGQTVEDACEKIVDVLGDVCTLVGVLTKGHRNAICASVAAAAEVLTATAPGDFFVVNRACKAGFRAIDLYCDNLDSSLVEGSPSSAEVICESISLYDNIADFFDRETIFLSPYAIFPDGNRVESPGQVIEIRPGATGLLPNTFTIQDVDDEPVITSLIVTPEDPLPYQDYLVHATYICPTPSMTVVMDIVGTDGYSNTDYCFAPTYSCTLFVPGAVELVRDLVTVQLSDNVLGYSFTRQVVIVF